MFKKSTRSKNIRRKIETDDAVEENLGEETVVSQTITKVARKKKNNQQQRSLSLSFAEEEEADVEEFKVKKSNASTRMSLGRKLKLPGSAEDTENQPQSTNAYTSEYLETLRQSTPSMPAALKMAAATSKTGTADDDDDALLAEKFPSLMKAEVGEMSIPDAHAIHAAKKKRELARKGIVQDDDEDFIALDDPREHSRLVREEDEIGDDGEAEFEQYVGERITLDKRAAKKMERERLEGVREMIEEAQEKDEERSEDVERWEEDLIRHGGVKPVRQQERDPYAPPLGYKPALVPNQTAIPNLADTLKDLDLVCNGLEQTLKEFETQIEQKQQGITKLQGTEEDLNKEIQHESNRFDYFQPLANYVNDLGEFLDAKFPILESLEKEAHDIIATKHEVVRQRRWQDDLDDLRQFAYVSGNVDDKDESVRQRRQIERQQRLAVRQDISEMGDGPETLQAQGFWSDDDMGADWEAQRDTRLQEIQDKRIEEMLEDVGSEFSDLAIVQRRFEAWKTQFNDDYTKAFGALSLPAAFEFYIRCELVSWDPMSEPVDFHDWKWHRILSEYGVTEDQEDMEEDANTELLSKAVEKVIIKRLKSMLDTLNAASMREMRNLEKLVEEISYYVEKHERAYQDLLAAIEIAIDKQIKPYANLMDTIVLHPGEHNAESKQRFFWRQCKYLKTLQIWKRQLPSKALESLADTIINRIIAPILQPTSNPSDAELQKEALQIASRLK